MNNAIRLSYELKKLKESPDVKIHSEFQQFLTQFGINSKRQTFSVILSRANIAYEYGDNKEFILHIDLNTGIRTFIAHNRKEYFKLDQGPDVLKLAEMNSDNYDVKKIGKSKKVKIGKFEMSAQHYAVFGKNAAIEIIANLRNDFPKSSTHLFWSFLLPLSLDFAPNLGVPIEIIVRDENDPGEIAINLKLVPHQQNNFPTIGNLKSYFITIQRISS